MINMLRNQRIFYWSCLLFLIFSSSLRAQTAETCDDGIDNDGDGLIDCYDPDCCGYTGCDSTFYDPCDVVATCIGPIEATNFSIINSRSSDVNIAPVIESGTPFVGDIDNDGITEYVAVNQHGPVYIFNDGANGLTLSATLFGGTVNGVNLSNQVPTTTNGIVTDPYPAIGDLDGDGEAEIVVRQFFNDHHHLCVYNTTGNLLAFLDLDASAFLYQGSGNIDNRSGTVGIYDFDGDGTPEISHGLGIFRYNPIGTGTRLVLLAYPDNVLGRGINNGYYGEQVVAVDIDDHNAQGYMYGLELIAGNTVYDVNSGGTWSVTTRGTARTVTTDTIVGDTLFYPDGYTSIVDWDGDDLLDVVVSSNRNGSAFIYIWNPRTEEIMAESNDIFNANSSLFFNRNMGRASVTDFDNDGALEIVATTTRSFNVFEASPLFSAMNPAIPLLELSTSLATTDRSGSTTCTAFDFNYDGLKEIVYRDEANLRIFNYDGNALTEIDTIPCSSGTVVEYPVVADVDNDGQAEIVCICDTSGHVDSVNTAVVTVFESGGSPWANTRSVWNQHAYFYANINDDLSIPVHQQNHALPDNGASFTYPGQINSFLHQHADTVFRIPNAVLGAITWNCDSNSITVEVCNEGDNTLPIGMPITLYAGNPQTTSPTIIGSGVLGINIPSGGFCETLTISLGSTIFQLPTEVYVMLNADASTPTPFDLANYTPPISTIIECDYTDNIGNLTIHPSPTIGINASVPNPVCQSSPVTLTATSSNNSISSLVWDPASIGTNNPVTIISTTVGMQTYSVTVTDNNGCNETASIDIITEKCCPIADDPSYFHLTANTDPALLTQHNINGPFVDANGITRYLLVGGVHHSLPSRVYIDNEIVVEVRGDGASLDLVNSDIVFGECARLEILNGAELKAYNTVFRPCSEVTSWGGVIFTRTAPTSTMPTGNIRECTFINADIGLSLGIYPTYGGTINNQTISDITIQDNLFSNCRRGIRVNNLAPNQAISGNDFQIDNVDNITFHDINCAPITNRNDYMGIQLLSTLDMAKIRWDYGLSIHQNTFIDATPVGSSNNEYTGIQSLTSTAQLEISANDFTNMFQSLNLAVPNSAESRYMMIENNEINVTRRSILNNIGSSQIVVRAGKNIEIFNNRLSCSADSEPLTILGGQAAFMQSAINIDNAEFTNVRDNDIEGFEVGIYIRQTGRTGERLIKIADNKIKSNYYGIFLDSELNTSVYNSLNAYIQCNEVEMDLEGHTTSVGIAVHFNDTISSSTNHFISGNCIKHTYRAIEIVNNTSLSARMPTVLNNYLYNYREAGISINGEFNRAGGTAPTIGQRNGGVFSTNDPFSGHNTFISNNENSAFDIFVTGTSTTVEAINNDYGTTGTAIVNNVIPSQASGIQYPSFAKCANQDASLTQDALNNLGAASNLYSCGEEAMLRLGVLLFRTNTSGSTTLTDNYTQSIQELVSEDKGSLLYRLTVNALANLSNQADKDALYTTVVNTGSLTTNETAWLSYHYEGGKGNYVRAKQVVEGIQGETEDEDEAQVIAILKMDLLISSRTVKELTNNEIQTLKDIDDRRGMNAVYARSMVDAAIGGHPYLFKPYPLSKVLSSEDVNRMNFTTASLTIYPNPTNDRINIDFVVTEGSNQVLNIYNATGKLIKTVSTKAMVGQLTVDVADLAQGMYIATLKSENGNVQSGKFVKR